MRYRENLNSIYILLFLTIAFYFFQIQDAQKYQFLFAFEASRFLGGEFWRLFTYPFLQSGPIALFFNLLILYIMGSAVEEEYGTRNFVLFILLSVVGSAAVALVLGTPLLGSFFISFPLLFIFATMVPDQVFYLFFILPVKVKWLAYIGVGYLILQVLGRSPIGIAAFGGSAITYLVYYLRFRRIRIARPRPAFKPVEPASGEAEDGGDANLERFRTMKEALVSGDRGRIDALITTIQPEIVPGVNICPPADYKPEHEDRYCIRCEGFAECSVRYVRLNSEAKDDEREANRSGLEASSS
ncbi:MAG TPA: rhomboid family intramembrane serine protease [Thermoanaerobaculia bacterium]|nr:rhomboid family intramembrane serine protease [Thermoanaerobaculia bacterium]